MPLRPGGEPPARDNLTKLALGFLWLGLLFSALAAHAGLPGVRRILSGVAELWTDGTLPHDIAVSSARWLIGWAFGSVIGIVVGLLTGRVRSIRVSFEGLMILLRAIPFISLVPLSLRVFGLSETGKFFLVGWASAGVCWVIVHQKSLEVPEQLVWRARSLGASRWLWLRRVLLPSCGDGLFAALRTSLSLGLIVVAVAELSGVFERSPDRWWSGGLGYRLFRSTDIARDDLMLATVLTFAVLGIGMDQVFVAVWGAGRRAMLKSRQRQVRDLVHRIRANPPPAEGPRLFAPPLRIDDLRAAYGAHVVFSDLSCVVAAGKTITVVGPSGSGKTTLIRAIGRFISRDLVVSGTVHIGADVVSTAGPRIGVVFQDAPVFEHLTVWDNLTFGNRIRSHPDVQSTRARCALLLDEFGLGGTAAQVAGTLSGGQRQRLALAMVIANEPEILLLDEPFGALDAITRRQLQDFYARKVHGKVTAVFVTHDLEEALLIGDSVRVGVGASHSVLEADKHGTPAHEWELTPEFAELRVRLIQALQAERRGPLASSSANGTGVVSAGSA
jgi:NitT/TauT family transport system ATP-binding protein